MALDITLPVATLTIEKNSVWFDVTYRSPGHSNRRQMTVRNPAASITGAVAGAFVRGIIDAQLSDVAEIFIKWNGPASGSEALPLQPEVARTVAEVNTLRRVVLTVQPSGITAVAYLLHSVAPVRRKTFANASGTVEGSGSAVETILATSLADVTTWSEA